METYTIPQIVEQRICIAPMTKEEFEIFYKSVEKLHKKDEPDFKHLRWHSKYYYRIYNHLGEQGVKFGSRDYNYSELIDENIKASHTITFSQIDFEESKVENPKNVWIHDGGYCKPENLLTEEEIKSKQETEDLDLTKILIEGETYYSPAYGYLIYTEFNEYDYHKPLLVFKHKETGVKQTIFTNGAIHNYGECLLFPSKEVRTWENYSPFKKGDVCYFWEEKHENGVVGLYFGKIDGFYCSATNSKEGLKSHISYLNCELFDPSKFNF